MEKEFFDAIKELLDSKDFITAAQQLQSCSTEEIAELLKNLDNQSLIPLCREMDSEQMADA